MITQKQAHSKDACYYGSNPEWKIAYSMHRDSNALERSNFCCFLQALKALPAVQNWPGEWQPVTVERSSHWGVGWIDRIIIDPACQEAIELAEQFHSALEYYPVLNDSDFSAEESKEADEVWKNCYSVAERIHYIRAHRDQFSFHDWTDMMDCIRGKYFAGYASELIH